DRKLGGSAGPAYADAEGPAHWPAPVRGTPRGPKLLRERRYGIEAARRHERGRGGPGAQVGEELEQPPLVDHLERGRLELLEGERDRAVAGLYQPPLGRPVWTHHRAVEASRRSVLRQVVPPLQAIAPHHKNAARHEHPAHLRVESRPVEP